MLQLIEGLVTPGGNLKTSRIRGEHLPLVVVLAVAASGCGPSWKEIRTDDGGFSVEMPGEASLTPSLVDLVEGQASGATWCVVQGGGSGWIEPLREIHLRKAGLPKMTCAMYLQMPSALRRPLDATQVVAELKAVFLRGLDHGEWLREAKTAEGGEGETHREYFCRGRIFGADVVGRVVIRIMNNRAYVLYAVGPTEWTITSPHTDRFLRSFSAVGDASDNRY